MLKIKIKNNLGRSHILSGNNEQAISKVVIRLLILSFSAACIISGTNAQPFDLLIKDGHLIDPKNQLDDKMDVAIANGKVAKVAKSIPPSEAKKL